MWMPALWTITQVLRFTFRFTLLTELMALLTELMELALLTELMELAQVVLASTLRTELMALMTLTQVVWSYPQRSSCTRTLCIALSARCG